MNQLDSIKAYALTLKFHKLTNLMLLLCDGKFILKAVRWHDRYNHANVEWFLGYTLNDAKTTLDFIARHSND